MYCLKIFIAKKVNPKRSNQRREKILPCHISYSLLSKQYPFSQPLFSFLTGFLFSGRFPVSSLTNKDDVWERMLSDLTARVCCSPREVEIVVTFIGLARRLGIRYCILNEYILTSMDRFLNIGSLVFFFYPTIGVSSLAVVPYIHLKNDSAVFYSLHNCWIGSSLFETTYFISESVN